MFTFNFTLLPLNYTGTGAVLTVPVVFFAAVEGCKITLALVSV